MTDPDPDDAVRGFGSAWSAGRARALGAQLREWLDFALAACDAADEVARAHFRRDLDLQQKPDRSFVTVADQAIERDIRAGILARWPDHGLVGEEYGEEAGRSTTRWYIDPIDGTHNFIRGVPLFGTLLAVEHHGEMQVGVISAPAMRERWYAYRGGGAWSDGLRRQAAGPVSRVGALEDSQLVMAASATTSRAASCPGSPSLIHASWRNRGFGDFWGHMLVAAGSAEAMVEADLKPWDLAAPASS